MWLDWDNSKQSINLKKHGLDFNDAAEVLEGWTFTFLDDGDYDEERYISLGLLKGIVVVIVHTPRNKTNRIISMRKASKDETNIFYEEVGNRLGAP